MHGEDALRLNATVPNGDRRELVPTAELIKALNVEPTAFGRQMGELGCRPRPGRISTPDGTSRQARGYLLTDIQAAITAQQNTPQPDNGLV